jgi:tetratricopeptide (TPR) repeat protein
LDKVGQAASHLNTEENTRIALVALNEAFEVRYEILGPTHADTVDSLNNIAAVHLNMRDYHLARKAYHEVYIVRQLIFGPRHPSVAITAHQLGGVHLALSQVEDAARYYQRALEIYQKLKFRSDNPTMKRLSRDIAELERLGGIVGAQC